MITPSHITELPEAPEYKLARLCIEQLQKKGLLPFESILDAPFDNKDQCQKLTIAAGKFGGSVAVIPQPLRDDNPQVKTGVLNARIAVAVFVTPNALRDLKAQDAASRMMAAVIRSLYRWRVEGDGIPYVEAKFEGVELLAPQEYEGLQDMQGLALTISKSVSYFD